jgi:hypothetical protein
MMYSVRVNAFDRQAVARADNERKYHGAVGAARRLDC